MRKSIYLAPVIAAGAAAAFLVMGSAGAALAGSNTGTTTATVTVGTQTTLTDATPTLAFISPVTLPGDAVNNPQPVSLQINTNDPLGGSIQVASATSNFQGAKQGDDPDFKASNLTVENGSSVIKTISTTPVTIDTIGIATGGNFPFTDNFSLHIPAVAGDVYSLQLNYVALGN
jgi:hypothetical protein